MIMRIPPSESPAGPTPAPAFICMYRCVYIHVHTYIHIYIYIYIHTHTYIQNEQLHYFSFTRLDRKGPAAMDLANFVEGPELRYIMCIYIYIYVYIYIYIYTHVQVYIYIYTLIIMIIMPWLRPHYHAVLRCGCIVLRRRCERAPQTCCITPLGHGVPRRSALCTVYSVVQRCVV